MPLAER